MKKVTISNDALEAINEAGRRAAELTYRLFGPFLSRDPLDPCISYNQVERVLACVKPLRDWTLGSREDAANHARNAYWKKAHRHNLRVADMGDRERRDIMKALAQDKRDRRTNRRRYFETVHINTILEAEREADAKREHERLFKAVMDEVRKKAVTEARYTTDDYIGIDNPTGVVDSAIRAAHRNPNADYFDMCDYLREFTAKEYNDFLDTLDLEFLFKPLDKKFAPAVASESVAD